MKLKTDTFGTIHQSSKPHVIDLFCGAGLLGYAFHKEKFALKAAYEFDKVAASTHRLNLPGSVTVCDLASYKPVGFCDLIIAGPPCQGFSSMGNRRVDDPRNSLCLIIPKWAKETGAKMVVIENVPAFINSPSWIKMRSKFQKMGYEVNYWILNSKDYGVPQHRLRSFTICSKIGLPDLSNLKKSKPFTVRDALKSLPPYPDMSIQHFSRIQSLQAQQRIDLIPIGGDIRNLAEKAPELVPPSWFKTNGKIIDIWGRIPWDGISNTLRTGFLNPSRGRFLHPSENRPISFREAARLQGLPDTFLFNGTSQQLSRQIGNGVPIGLGRAVAKEVFAVLKSQREATFAFS